MTSPIYYFAHLAKRNIFMEKVAWNSYFTHGLRQGYLKRLKIWTVLSHQWKISVYNLAEFINQSRKIHIFCLLCNNVICIGRILIFVTSADCMGSIKCKFVNMTRLACIWKILDSNGYEFEREATVMSNSNYMAVLITDIYMSITPCNVLSGS